MSARTKRHSRTAAITLSLPGDSAPATLHMPFAEDGTRRSAVVIASSPFLVEHEADLADSLGSLLASHGIAVTTLPVDVPGNGIVPRAIARSLAALDQTAEHPAVDPSRIGMIGIGLAAPVAAVVASQRPSVARLCLIGPAASELTARKPLPGSASAHAAPVELLESLTQLQPLKAAVQHAGATLILHGAADDSFPPEHSYAYAAALEFTEKLVDFHLIAFADHACSRDADRTVATRLAGEFFRAMDTS